MSVLNKQELQVIQAFSSADLPEQIFRDSNIKGLISGIVEEQEAVKKSAEHLGGLRQDQKDGNFITNWWNDRDDRLQDAQIDLNKSIGHLTQKSSQLLVINTAISKVLNDQQRILLEQQSTLQTQTNELEEQNHKILAQQKLLEKQQKEINEANQGLMDAKGVTQEQAKQLVGCVKRVTEAENKIGEDNQKLLVVLEERVDQSAIRLAKQLQNGLSELEKRNETLAQIMAEKHIAQQTRVQTLQDTLTQAQQSSRQQLLHQLELKSSELLDSVTSVCRQYDALQQELTLKLVQQDERQQNAEAAVEVLRVQISKFRYRSRLVIATMGLAIGLSIGWQVVQHFALF